jgi:hypothetical protein
MKSGGGGEKMSVKDLQKEAEAKLNSLIRQHTGLKTGRKKAIRKGRKRE